MDKMKVMVSDIVLPDWGECHDTTCIARIFGN